MPCMMNEFGAVQMCPEGCEHMCDDCKRELWEGDADKTYVGSGEDLPPVRKHARKAETISL
jgi:hypothetical protein